MGSSCLVFRNKKTSEWPSLAEQSRVFNKMLVIIVINSCDHISWQNNQDERLYYGVIKTSYRHRRCGAAEWVIWGWGVWWRGPQTHRDTPQTQTCRSRSLALAPWGDRKILHVTRGPKDKETTLKGPENLFSQSASYYEWWDPASTLYYLPKDEGANTCSDANTDVFLFTK